jgi:hypothetical protein
MREVGGRRSEVGGRRSEGRGRRFRIDLTAVNVAAVADAEEVNSVLINVHGVNDTVIADSKPAPIGSFQAMIDDDDRQHL